MQREGTSLVKGSIIKHFTKGKNRCNVREYYVIKGRRRRNKVK